MVKKQKHVQTLYVNDLVFLLLDPPKNFLFEAKTKLAEISSLLNKEMPSTYCSLDASK